MTMLKPIMELPNFVLSLNSCSIMLVATKLGIAISNAAMRTISPWNLKKYNAPISNNGAKMSLYNREIPIVKASDLEKVSDSCIPMEKSAKGETVEDNCPKNGFKPSISMNLGNSKANMQPINGGNVRTRFSI